LNEAREAERNLQVENSVDGLTPNPKTLSNCVSIQIATYMFVSFKF
jgi:hypothetical protein